MNRVLVLNGYMVRDLFRSLAGAVPPLLTLGVYQATFYFGGKVDYFASVGGADMMLVCIVTTLIFLSRANRATTYALLARLPHRSELIAAVALSAFAVSTAMCILLTFLVVVTNRLTATPFELLAIAPRWFVLLVFSIALACNMGKLVSRAGSYLVVIGAVAIMVTIAEQRVFLLRDSQNWLVDIVAGLSAPIATTLTVPVGAFEFAQYAWPMLLTLLYALVLFVLAGLLFRRKDLLWAE